MSYGYDSRDEMTAEQSVLAGSGSGGASVYSDLFGYDLSFNPTSFKGSSLTQNADNQFSLSGLHLRRQRHPLRCLDSVADSPDTLDAL